MYAKISDIQEMLPDAILIRLSDDDSEGVIQETRIQEGIDTASAEIDTYINGRLSLPLSEPYPEILIKLCEDIAIYNIYSRLKEEIPSTRQVRYNNAIKWLIAFMSGKVSIPDYTEQRRSAVFSSRTKIYDDDLWEMF